jgi:hypothetical protein
VRARRRHRPLAVKRLAGAVRGAADVHMCCEEDERRPRARAATCTWPRRALSTTRFVSRPASRHGTAWCVSTLVVSRGAAAEHTEATSPAAHSSNMLPSSIVVSYRGLIGDLISHARCGACEAALRALNDIGEPREALLHLAGSEQRRSQQLSTPTPRRLQRACRTSCCRARG